ncbi:MAG: GDP-mannose 4,6-dehydratase [Chloroflexota bacterium]
MLSNNNHPILITGSAGFIGSHLADAMLARGLRVVGLDNFDSYYDPEVKRRNISDAVKDPNFKLVECDIRDGEAVGRAFKLGPFAAIVHLAARAGVRPSITHPLLYDSVNVLGTTTLLDQARQTPETHFVFGSSSSVYGASSSVPFTEDVGADKPSSPYAATKRAGEMTAFAFHHLYGMPVTCLRFFTVYGPRQRPEMAIYKFTRLIDHGRPVEIFGDGSSRRDYTYVADIVHGISLAIDNPAGYRIINLGTTTTTPLLELVELIAVRMGRPLKLEYLPDQPGDVPITFADISRAKTELGYAPTTGIHTGLNQFLEWYRLSSSNS